MEGVRVVSIVLAALGLAVYLILAAREVKSRPYFFAPLSWLLFVIAFLVASHGTHNGWWVVSPEVLNIWSASIRLWSLIVVVGGGIIWLMYPGEKRKHGD